MPRAAQHEDVMQLQANAYELESAVDSIASRTSMLEQAVAVTSAARACSAASAAVLTESLENAAERWVERRDEEWWAAAAANRLRQRHETDQLSMNALKAALHEAQEEVSAERRRQRLCRPPPKKNLLVCPPQHKMTIARKLGFSIRFVQLLVGF